MMTLVRRGDAILLARHAASPTSRFTALAGFLEAGESIEEAIHREVFEEVGLAVQHLTYFASQSWPFPHSLMIAFTAEYAGGELALDRNEIAEARWVGPDDALPEIPPGVSIAAALIDAQSAAARVTGSCGAALGPTRDKPFEHRHRSRAEQEKALAKRAFELVAGEGFEPSTFGL